MKTKRKHYSGEEKVAILRKHLLDGIAISDLCDDYGLHPNGFLRAKFRFTLNQHR